MKLNYFKIFKKIISIQLIISITFLFQIYNSYSQSNIITFEIPSVNISVYNDLNQNCILDNELGINGINVYIQPGNLIVTSNSFGVASLSNLPDGTYTATIDTTNLNWSPTCGTSQQNFTISNGQTQCFGFGLINDNPCTSPIVSIYAPFLRRCFNNQIYVQACNDSLATGVLSNAYVDIELDPYFILNSASTNQNFGTTTYIDVTTDAWGYENYWELVPSGNACGVSTIFSGGNPSVGCNGGGLQSVISGGYASNNTISEGPFNLTFGNQYDIISIDDWGDGGTCFTVNGQNYCEAVNSSSNVFTFNALNGNINYTNLGNNVYRFDIGDLNPGECANFTINATVSCNAILGETLCMDAALYPVEGCALDTIPTPPLPPAYGNDPNLVMPQECTLPWDNSSLQVDGWCQGDSVHFSITNTGDFGGGDMDCYSPVLLYVNDTLVLIDSVQIQGQQTVYFSYPANGQTFILNAEQHPLHPGNSHPNAHVELCGSDSTQWVPNLVNNQPMDDADPVVDIYCGVVTGSYDPNDKTGYPLGVTDQNFIHPNRQLQYVVRFQNTGTDTAFTVVIRDTLDTDLNIFTVNSGVSSHEYTFQMKGQRVLEWTFNNILLPDSTTNEPESNGFVTFTVDQIPNLPEGTLITNEADIYFDFNAPIITNQTEHRISYFTESSPLLNCTLGPDIDPLSAVTECSSYDLTSIQGSFLTGQENYYTLQGGPDVMGQSVVTGPITTSGTVYAYDEKLGCFSEQALNVTINTLQTGTDVQNQCDSYTWIDGLTYNASTNIPTYTYVNGAANGCDSIITLNLTITNSNSSSESITECDNYTWSTNGQTYTESGQFTEVLTNQSGCDSTITINLTITNSNSSTESITECDSYTWSTNGQIYTESGQYTEILSNQSGCDSTITINLIINSSSYSTQTQTGIDSYTWPVNNETYTESGTYTAVIPNSVGCDSTITLNLTLESVGLDETESSYVAVYPNPTFNSFILSTKDMINMNYTLLDIQGKVVLTGKIESPNEKVDISNLSRGQYNLVFEDESIRPISIIKD